MGPLAWCAGEASALLVTAARTSQTMVIAGVDLVARDRRSDRVRLLGRLWGVQLDLLAVSVGDPERAVDDGYATAARLLDLHREFVRRLFEILDTDIGPSRAEATPSPDAQVIRLRAR